MSGTFVPPGKQRFVDPDTGEALSNGFVYMFIPGTDTPKDTFQDQAETESNTNPITLDGDGQCTIWGDGLYRQILQRSDTTQVWDEVTGFSGSGGGVTFATPAQVAALTAHGLAIDPYSLGASGVLGGGGGSGYGMHKPLSTFGALSLDGSTVGSNDSIIAAAEADTTSLRYYTPYGIIRTDLNNTQLTKGYTGDAGIICGPGAGDGAYRPPNYAYMAVKPSTWPVQGDGGFWRGDNRFNDGGEWKIIGTGVRTYDITSRYYEQNTIPHPAWLDINSGGSGIDAFLQNGATAGSSTITLSEAGTAAWIGKVAAFSLTSDGSVAESHTITGVSGNTLSIAPAVLTNSYTWNPGASQTPCIFFGHRTWGGVGYVKIRHNAAGDSYGDNVRQNVNYVPLPTQYHSFMASTGGQYGGDVTFNSSGVYGQFFESQLQGGTFDVTSIGFVASYVRNVDYALDGGKYWAGTFSESGGTRPCDAAHVVLGAWRNGLDTVFATMEETSRLTVLANAGATTITVASTNGAHPNDICIVGSETKTIQSVNTGAKTVTFTTGLAGSYAVDQLILYPQGGATVNMASGQRMVWNSSLSANARSADPTNVFPAFYGNVQGDLIMGSGTDGAGDFWSVRFANGTTAAVPDTSRLRLRRNGVQMFGNTGRGTNSFTMSGGDLGLTDNLNIVAGALCTFGSGVWITWDGSNLKATKNGGSSYTNIV